MKLTQKLILVVTAALAVCVSPLARAGGSADIWGTTTPGYILPLGAYTGTNAIAWNVYTNASVATNTLFNALVAPGNAIIPATGANTNFPYEAFTVNMRDYVGYAAALLIAPTNAITMLGNGGSSTTPFTAGIVSSNAYTGVVTTNLFTLVLGQTNCFQSILFDTTANGGFVYPYYQVPAGSTNIFGIVILGVQKNN
jgi:hypothetical protein